MNRIATLLCGLAFAAATALPQPAAPSSTFYTVTYYQVEPDKRSQYDQLLSTSGKKFYQSRIDSGEVLAWIGYRVVLPNVSAAPYTHVGAVAWAKAPKLDPGEEATSAAYAKAGLNLAAERDKIRTIGRKVVKREVWRLYDQTGEWASQGDFVRIDPRQVTNMGEYVNLERTIWKPMHEQRIKHGALKGWAGLVLSLPGGDGYNAATVEIYKDESQMFEAPRPPQPIYKLAFPDKDITAEMKRMMELKKDHSRSLLRVDHIVAKR